MATPETAPPPPDEPTPDPPFRSLHTPGLPGLLADQAITVLASSYQSGKLLALRASPCRVSTLLRHFQSPMGIAVKDRRQLAVVARSQVWLFRNAPDIAPRIQPPGQHDACFLPRLSFVTGDIRGHEAAWAGDELWVVNTRFSCLCNPHPDYNFVPRWRPPFVPALAADDCCHLNGLALLQGSPRYVTALGETSTPAGWRANKAAGGVLIDVPSGQVVCRGLSMPHSPRLHAGRLWVLESGTGRVQVADPATGRRDTVAELPGFTRGLAFHGSYAFVGLSKIRETAVFGGLPLAERVKDLCCGVWVLDTNTGQTVEFIRFEAGIEEIFAVEVLAGVRFPEIVGFEEPTVRETFVTPAPG